MQTYSVDHPSGAQFELDWNGDNPPTNDQLGSILASDSGIPNSADDTSNPSAWPQNDQVIGFSRQAPALMPPSGPLSSSIGTSNANGRFSPSAVGPSSASGSHNVPLYRDLLDVDNTITGQPGGQRMSPSGDPTQLTDSARSSGTSNTTSANGSGDPLLFTDAHHRQAPVVSTGWSPPTPGTRRRSTPFRGADFDPTPNNSIPYHGAKTDATHTDPEMWTPNYPPGNATNELKDLYPSTADTLHKLGYTGMIFQGIGDDYSSDGTHFATGEYFANPDGRGPAQPKYYTAAVDLYIGPLAGQGGTMTLQKVNEILHNLRMAGLAAWFRPKSSEERIRTSKDANLNNHIHLVDPIINQINPYPYNQVIDFVRGGTGAIGQNAGRKDQSITLAERPAVARRYNLGNFGDNELMTIPQR